MARKTVFGGLRTTKAQTSLRFRSDLELASPNKAVGGGTAMTTFKAKKGFSRTTFCGQSMLILPGYFFSFL